MAEGQQGRAAFRTRAAEIAVAAFFFALGALVMYDSVRLGSGWGADGPRAGYFPFYVGLLICLSSVVNVVRALLVPAAKNKAFVEVQQLKMVLTVLIPTMIYVGAVTWIGIYVSSTVFIAFFMRWLGKYVWWKVAAVSIATSVVFFIIFEKWFQVPLPKGPLENLLGLG
jgi:putative tricarboxylic transport membrane protein